jgi:FHA domain-containing protein
MDRVVVEIREPGKEPRRITMTTSVEVGRDCSGVIIADAAASRRHAALTPSPDGVTVTDLGSRNGTRVNGKRITAPVNVGPRDVVEIGETRFALVERTAPPPPSAKAPPIAATEVLLSEAVDTSDGTTQRIERPARGRIDGGATVPNLELRGQRDDAAIRDLDARMQAAHAWVTQAVGEVDMASFQRAVLSVGLEHLEDVLARLRRA